MTNPSDAVTFGTAAMWVANAPCSFGTFELSDGPVSNGEDLLALVADAGYAGLDLGPVGLLGSVDTIADNLRRHQLALAGGWIQLPFADEAVQLREIELTAILDIFDAAAAAAPDAPVARPTLACAAAVARMGLAPGSAAKDHNLGLDSAGWQRLVAGVEWATRICRDRGYEPCFHPHVATWVEAPWEIDQLLASTDVSLCLDPGHLLTGGGDVSSTLARWGERIAQVHIKDVRTSVIAAIYESGGDAMEVWRREAFTRLGDGDVDIPLLISELRGLGYRGWLVVEQDVLPLRDGYLERAIADQRANREMLRALGV